MYASWERYLPARVKSRILQIFSRLVTRDGIAAAGIALAPLVYFLPATLGRIVLAADDALVFGLPLRITIAHMIRDGHLPLWNPYIFCGMPLLASAQGGVLFPLNWTFLILGPRAAMNIAVLASYAIAGLGAFLYARRSGANLLGAIVTGLIWQMCGASIGQVSHTNILHVFAILPWIFWSIDGYAMRPTDMRGALIAIFVALQVFAGHPQTLVYSLLLAAVYAIVNGIAERNRFWLLSLLFMAIGLLLAAVQILPTIELLRSSLRSVSSYEFFSSYSLPPIFLLTYFAPYVVGGGDGTLFRAPYISEPYYPEYCGYFGIASLILAIIAPLIRRDCKTLFWTTSVFVALALALGRSWPFDLYQVVYRVPILNLFRVPARHLMEVDFAFAVLAGRALTFLPQVPRMRRTVVTAGVGTCVVFISWAVVTFLRPAEFRLARVAPVSILRAPELFMPLILAGVSCWFLIRFARGRRFSGAFLVALILVDLAMWGQFTGWRRYSPPRHDPIFSTPLVVKVLREEPQPYRILTLDRTLSDALANRGAMPSPDISLQPDTYMIHRIANAAGYDGFGLKSYSQLAGDMKVWGEFPDQPRSLLVSRDLDLLNVRYLIAAEKRSGMQQSPDNAPALSSRWTEITRMGQVMIYQNPKALPRTWLATDSRALTDREKLKVIRTGKFSDGTTWEPERTALVEGVSLSSNTTSDGESKIVRYDPNEVEIAARTGSPAILVLADNYYPGWRVAVDGKRAPLLRVDYNLRAVQLEPGTHNVRFTYRAKSFEAGALISTISAFILAAFAWWRRT